MKLCTIVLLAGAIQGASATELSALRGRRATIIEQEDTQEITTEQARRKVQLLLKDFEAWAEAHAVQLELRSRTYTSSPNEPGEVDDPLSINRCPLFYKDNADELCLIDLKRTEVWAASLLFCRYQCE